MTVKRYDNRLITRERAKKANYGLELTLFDALNIQLDYFTEHRTNILMAVSYTHLTLPTT